MKECVTSRGLRKRPSRDFLDDKLLTNYFAISRITLSATKARKIEINDDRAHDRDAGVAKL